MIYSIILTYLKQETCACYEEHGYYVWGGYGPEDKIKVIVWEVETVQTQGGTTAQEVGTEEGTEAGDPYPIFIVWHSFEECLVGEKHEGWGKDHQEEKGQ